MVDPTARKAGRGAYLCKKVSCWDMAIRKDKLGYALKSKISPDDRRAIEEFVKTLPPEGEKTSFAAIGAT